MPDPSPSDPEMTDDSRTSDEQTGGETANPDDGSVSEGTPADSTADQDIEDGTSPHDVPADRTVPPDESAPLSTGDVPEDVRRYARFTKMDGAAYDRVNDFLRDRTYVTAREWAIARLCADFRTETGVEMTKIGENLPELVPFMTDTYSPQAVNQARSSFEDKVTKSGATFLYGAMSGFFTAEELDDLMYEVTEVAKFLLEVEGADLAARDELDVEDRISEVMRDVRRSSESFRAEETGHDHETCPHCGEELSE